MKWCVGFLLGVCGLMLFAADSGDKLRHENAAKMLSVLKSYQAGTPDTAPVRKLKILYVTPKDMKPQPRCQERITALFDDFNDFLREEFSRNGFGERTLSVERDVNNRVILHHVTGRLNADSYSYSSAGEVNLDIEATFGDRLRFPEETVLIFCGFSRTEKDGSVRIFSPYHGWDPSNQKRGRAYIMDHEYLDVAGLSDSVTQLNVYEKHKRVMTPAVFNNTYIGGTFHELGHALGLPHNVNMKDEVVPGAPLMGDGNYFYRADRGGVAKRTYLSAVECCRLISHPLISGCSRDYAWFVKSDITDFQCVVDSQHVTVRGKIVSELPAYGMAVYADPADHENDKYGVNNNYDARNWVTVPAQDGSFSCRFPLENLGKVKWQLRLVPCFLNGSSNTFCYGFDGSKQIK